MSTGGAATKAMTKQMVAASSVGIISTPNQPTYRRLLVEVTHSQKACQLEGGALLEGGGHENGKKCSRRNGLRKGRKALPVFECNGSLRCV